MKNETDGIGSNKVARAVDEGAELGEISKEVSLGEGGKLNGKAQEVKDKDAGTEGKIRATSATKNWGSSTASTYVRGSRNAADAECSYWSKAGGAAAKARAQGDAEEIREKFRGKRDIRRWLMLVDLTIRGLFIY